MLGRLISANFRHPKGILGRIAGNIMARGNEPEIRWTVDLLNIQPDDHVLEVGFGPGVGIQYAARKALSGFVAGLDFSDTMVQVASKRNQDALKAGRVALRQGDVAALPYPADAFDKAFGVHCLYFWAKPAVGLAELRRVLKPKGQLALTMTPKDKWPPAQLPPADLFTLYQPEEVASLFSEAGWHAIRVETFPEPGRFPGVSVVGSK